MRVRLAATAILIATIASRVAAQEPVVDSGARVRISTDSGVAALGSLVRADSAGFWVLPDSADHQVFVRRWSVKKLEVSLGQRHHVGDGAGIGLLVGGGIGVVIGLADGSDPPNSIIGFSAGAKAAILGVTFGAIGAGFGALVGSGMHEDDWHEYQPSNVHVSLSISPRGAGVGVAISF